MIQNRKLVDMSRWLEENEKPKMLYYFELYSGERGEADSPLCLFDLLVDGAYSDCDDRGAHIVMLGTFLRDITAAQLSPKQIRATVYSGKGPFYDNAISKHQDEIEEEGDIFFDNPNDPIILDFWDEWTTMASLIKVGYLKLYEKVDTFGAQTQDSTCSSCAFYNAEEDSCPAWQGKNVLERMQGCPFWTANGRSQEEYKEVIPEKLNEPLWKSNYVPIANRNEEYKGFRK